MRSWLLIGFVFCSVLVQAHESRPLFVELVEVEPGLFELQYKIPSSIPQFNSPEVILPEEFEPLGTIATYLLGQGLLRTRQYKSSVAVNGLEIGIRYPVINPSVSSIIRLHKLDGSHFQTVLGPDQLSWTIPEEESFWGVAWQYNLLGIEHILVGWDHLLFLVCLILVAGTGRTLLITITGFTLAHSITLALSALNVVQVPIPPVEAVIALSVVFLATEIAGQNRNSLTFKYPIAVSASFGLLHGFGFAAVLGEIGLPQKEVVTSLLFFNIGVEIGQILFILAVLLIFRMAHNIFSLTTSDQQLIKLLPKFQKVTIYVVGCIASYWMVERVAGFF